MATREYMKKYHADRTRRAQAILGGKCARCGATDRLQFDHVDPSTKTRQVSILLREAWSKVLKELAKCQLLCGKCHRQKTKSNQESHEKLSVEKAAEIRERYKAEAVSQRQLASEYDVHQSIIWGVLNGTRWA